jgi:hypothetical protein
MQMEMSKAALPARYGRASEQDEKHPLFSIYRRYRSGLSMLLVDSEDFCDWLFNYEQSLIRENATKHPQYSDFMKWMVANKGGARKCPAGAFPHNFNFWLEGGRW